VSVNNGDLFRTYLTTLCQLCILHIDERGMIINGKGKIVPV